MNQTSIYVLFGWTSTDAVNILKRLIDADVPDFNKLLDYEDDYEDLNFDKKLYFRQALEKYNIKNDSHIDIDTVIKNMVEHINDKLKCNYPELHFDIIGLPHRAYECLYFGQMRNIKNGSSYTFIELNCFTTYDLRNFMDEYNTSKYLV